MQILCLLDLFVKRYKMSPTITPFHKNRKDSQRLLRYACSEFYHKWHEYASCRLLRQLDKHPLAGLHSISRMAGRTISWSSTVTGSVGQFSMAVSTSFPASPTRMVSSDFVPVMDGFQA